MRHRLALALVLLACSPPPATVAPLVPAASVGPAGSAPPQPLPPAAASVGPAGSAPPQPLPPAAGCLPAHLHGRLLDRRGTWRLYASVSGDALLLEHDGPELLIDEPRVAAMRRRLDSPAILEPPVHAFGYGLCDVTVGPARGVCLGAAILPGSDPFTLADRLDRAMADHGARACYGVHVTVSDMALAW
ncbi:hypothetical protein [Nannocystis punicea]|uniref:Uncharacterized protein n=1 Tax=Nannocystis punicea TaxID=2995304 RepID=A0ABY7HEK6_9BACT|nr:hypothetical protein [Nannocystis poenicansa]WAS97459.1 hypothetical protein O0S08_15035 [Nannocystis poenicansa]